MQQRGIIGGVTRHDGIRPIVRSVTERSARGVAGSGDYLIDEGGNYLIDESANRLTP